MAKARCFGDEGLSDHVLGAPGMGPSCTHTCRDHHHHHAFTSVTTDRVKKRGMRSIYDSQCNHSSDKGHLQGLAPLGQAEGNLQSHPKELIQWEEGTASHQHLAVEKCKQQSGRGDTLEAATRSPSAMPEEHAQDSNCTYQRAAGGSVQQSTAATSHGKDAQKKWPQD